MSRFFRFFFDFEVLFFIFSKKKAIVISFLWFLPKKQREALSKESASADVLYAFFAISYKNIRTYFFFFLKIAPKSCARRPGSFLRFFLSRSIHCFRLAKLSLSPFASRRRDCS